MKRSVVFPLVLMAAALAARPALAVEAPKTYQGNLLVLLFLGVCALIVVAQIVPALILMMGTISGLSRRMSAKRQAAGISQEEKD
jgi:hypothetical protein